MKCKQRLDVIETMFGTMKVKTFKYSKLSKRNKEYVRDCYLQDNPNAKPIEYEKDGIIATDETNYDHYIENMEMPSVDDVEGIKKLIEIIETIY